MKLKTMVWIWLALVFTLVAGWSMAWAADAPGVAVRTVRAMPAATVAATVAGTAATTAATTAAAPAATPLPTDSLYHLQAHLVDQNGRPFDWGAQRGQPLLVSMFYTSCQFVCPMLVEAIKSTQAQLAPAERERLQVLLVTLDPLHDSVSVLKQTAEQRQLDDKHWLLARTDAHSVRKIAALLGVQYRDLGNGDFNHSTVVLLLDAEGRIQGRTSQLGNADPAFVKRVKASLQIAAH
jgi:protein SCO1